MGALAPRVLVVSGSYGAGHDAAAHEVRRCLEGAGHAVDLADVADLLPWRLGHLLRRTYFAQLGAVPGTWRTLLGLLDRREGPARVLGDAVTWLLGVLPARRLLAQVRPGTVCVVATHPFAALALGRLRRRGRLAVPAVTYLTDPSVHRLWVAEGVDHHIALHAAAARQARRRGAAGVRLVRPPAPASCERTPSASEVAALRAAWGVPEGRPVALVVGGSEGVGELEGAATDLLATGLVTPVVACGHNEALRARLRAVPGVVALGWSDGLAPALVAADVVVHNAGGFTTLEALHLGRPLVSYRCVPGHGEDNAAALAGDGLASWPRCPEALPAALAQALDGVGRRDASGWRTRPELLAALPVRPERGAQGRVEPRVGRPVPA